jgi:hypothetical protein
MEKGCLKKKNRAEAGEFFATPLKIKQSRSRNGVGTRLSRGEAKGRLYAPFKWRDQRTLKKDILSTPISKSVGL